MRSQAFHMENIRNYTRLKKEMGGKIRQVLFQTCITVLLSVGPWLSKPALASIYNIHTVDSAGNVGLETSIALDEDGNSHISYLDRTNDSLKYAAFDDNVIDSVNVQETGGTTQVSEREESSDYYTMVLYSQPANDVNIAINYDANQVTTAPNPLVFTDSNWNMPQTVTITAIDDDQLEDYEHTTTITHTADSADPKYDGIDISSVEAAIYDNECGVWHYLQADINKDCIVDVQDLAIIASNWLSCTQPDIPECREP